MFALGGDFVEKKETIVDALFKSFSSRAKSSLKAQCKSPFINRIPLPLRPFDGSIIGNHPSSLYSDSRMSKGLKSMKTEPIASPLYWFALSQIYYFINISTLSSIGYSWRMLSSIA